LDYRVKNDTTNIFCKASRNEEMLKLNLEIIKGKDEVFDDCKDIVH